MKPSKLKFLPKLKPNGINPLYGNGVCILFDGILGIGISINYYMHNYLTEGEQLYYCN